MGNRHRDAARHELRLFEDLAPWVDGHTAPQARIGAFNGGIVSYCSHRPLVNRDSVMNDSAIAAMRDDRLCDYIDGEKIDYLVGNDEAIAFFFKRNASCENPRREWHVVHRVRWPPDRTVNRFTFIVLGRTRATD